MQRTLTRGHVKMAGLCCGLGLMTTSLLWAQQPGAQQRQAQRQTGEKQFCLATEVIGMNVKAKGEEQAGQVQNLIINSQGEVQYLAIGGGAQASAATPADRTPQRAEEQPSQAPAARAAAGGAGQLRLVPWELAKFHPGATPAQSYVSLEIEKERLMQAPAFTQQQLTAQAGQAQVIAQVDQFFNVQQRGAARPELDRERPQQGEQNRPPQQRDN